VVAARGPQRGSDLGASQPRCPRRVRGAPQQCQRIRRGQVVEGLHGGGKELQQNRPQPKHMTGPLPDRGLVRASQELHGVGQLTVPGDLAVMIPVQADDLREHMRITSIGLRTRGGVPLPVPRRRERIDREHLVPGGPQRRHPRTAVSLDPDDHPRRYFPGRQLRPARGSMLGDERVQPGDALQPFRQPGPCQPPPVLVLELHIMVVLSPVISDKQHPQQLLRIRPAQSQHPETPAP
jgi:hypothetical protein